MRIKGAFERGESRIDRVPVSFGILLPDRSDLLSDYVLVSHVNPSSLDERMSQKIERIQTKGGWVEQHWGEELDEISASQTTGAFFDLSHGLTGEAIFRRNTIAYDRFHDLIELYRNNGSIYNSGGQILFQGRVVVNYASQDRMEKRYEGYFINFEVSEEEKPWSFSLSWSFKVITGDTFVGYQGLR